MIPHDQLTALIAVGREAEPCCLPIGRGEDDKTASDLVRNHEAFVCLAANLAVEMAEELIEARAEIARLQTTLQNIDTMYVEPIVADFRAEIAKLRAQIEELQSRP